MANFLLVLHLMIAIGLVAVILLQRSEGGALGIGGGSGALMSGRGAGDMLTRGTQILAAAFFVTSIGLAIATGSAGSGSIADDLPGEGEQEQTTTVPGLGDDLLESLGPSDSPRAGAPDLTFDLEPDAETGEPADADEAGTTGEADAPPAAAESEGGVEPEAPGDEPAPDGDTP